MLFVIPFVILSAMAFLAITLSAIKSKTLPFVLATVLPASYFIGVFLVARAQGDPGAPWALLLFFWTLILAVGLNATILFGHWLFKKLRKKRKGILRSDQKDKPVEWKEDP